MVMAWFGVGVGVGVGLGWVGLGCELLVEGGDKFGGIAELASIHLGAHHLGDRVDALVGVASGSDDRSDSLSRRAQLFNQFVFVHGGGGVGFGVGVGCCLLATTQP
jgi:hypothetical protein